MKMTKWIKSGLLAIAITGATMAAPMAQEIAESHLEAARKAITAIQATARFDEILPEIALRITSQMIANNPDLETQINDTVDSETLALVSRRADLEKEAALVYAKSISEEDLNAIAAFYTSDAGKALLNNGAILAREVQQAASVWQRGIERDLLENVNEKLKEVAPRSVEDKTDDATDTKTE
ncbi:DUF2059 domain-containing protein [Ahrensia kielensis]|uniref:DUF2059 domain-containing protein n=1 Tax=Ahrensia kielensis TaxID=76980 RepID=A0ABU9T543_9HYPH